jgi:hypothetical protein
VGVQFDSNRDRFIVRWYEDGKKRCRRFETEEDAEAFDATLIRSRGRPSEATTSAAGRTPGSGRGDGVYAYKTAKGTRWRFVFRHSDGSLSSRRGFISRRAAITARRKLLESVARREVRPARETFGSFWAKLLVEKRPYMSAGSMQDFATHGRKRLLPTFGDMKLAHIDDDRVRAWLSELVELVEAGELSPKTVNHARTCLAVACNVAVKRGLMPRNPCDDVPPLPLSQEETDYLRLAEIESYLDACADFYRALGETLLGTGARISEATAFRWRDLDLAAGVGARVPSARP